VTIAERWGYAKQDAALALGQAAWMMSVSPHVGLIVYEQDLQLPIQIFLSPVQIQRNR
jgi:hypothetical protein